MSKNLKIRSDLSPTTAKWFAVYAKYKCEKMVGEHLTRKGIESYVPLVQTTKRYTRKIKTYHKPLFNCYLFVKIKQADYIRVLETDHVLHFIKLNRELISIPQDEINLLKRIVGESEEIEVNSEFIEGMEVEMISGNLTGIKGKLIKTTNNKNFLVELNQIGFQLRIQINPVHLRPVHKLESLLK